MNECEQIRKEYNDIISLKQEFDSALAEAQTEANTSQEVKDALERAKELKKELEEKMKALKEELYWPFEALPKKELKEQYESQRKILQKNNILKKLSTGELGIKGIDGKEYVFPTYQEIARRMRENKEIIKTKTEQGFTKLLIVPFGMKLGDLVEKYKQAILRHHKAQKLFAPKEKQTDPNLPIGLLSDSVVWSSWSSDDDTAGLLVYYPQEFSQNHQGKTKREILEEEGGWNILLVEDLPIIPREGQGKTIGGRKQLESRKSLAKYLEIIQNDPSYQNESGMTPEDYIVYAITHLEQTDQVIDFREAFSRDSSPCLIGAYLPPRGVPGAQWRDSLHCAKFFYFDLLSPHRPRLDPYTLFVRGVRTGVRLAPYRPNTPRIVPR